MTKKNGIQKRLSNVLMRVRSPHHPSSARSSCDEEARPPVPLSPTVLTLEDTVPEHPPHDDSDDAGATLAEVSVPFVSVTNAATSRFSFNDSKKPSLPLPTNCWWQNLVLGDGGTQVSCPPYLVRLPTDGPSRVEIGWPKIHVGEEAMWQVWIDDWQLIWNPDESAAPLKREVVDYDDLSVTVQWPSRQSSNTWARQTLVKATPYTTVEFKQMKQIQMKTRHSILQFEQHKANSWKVLLNSGQTWIVYVIDGVVRVAAVPDEINDSLALLTKHHSSYPVGGTFSWQVQSVQTSDDPAAKKSGKHHCQHDGCAVE
ncbi:hypothetical protein SYNPS1DRAFT_30028 [Syncephalis pseudoplumigaleata]|uniref:Glycosyl hydrolase family 81 N-terminal domain-containing protein n=1 Tax=Syncephalis pseudoplumigaleata TaxID=1712513 RepID=A0A4P9YWH5_9FUNG|nr:hypothetical protein SYNPS1DRAFT_30028 [Syncephalis pseudoplumigaleata]|eukprot:RKP24205.1 hypothetical protein SYNPS1DRAFT_30028 [Syncephalis pseudoplumigaleata]